MEHDEETIREADYVVDLGPGAGLEGGYVVAEGTPAEIERAIHGSLTGSIFREGIPVETPAQRREPKGHLEIKGAAENNLKKIERLISPWSALLCYRGFRVRQIDTGD